MDDLWPSSFSSHTASIPPIKTLRRQASLLGGKTGNIVEAKVKAGALSRAQATHDFVYDFFLVGPVLGDYHYRLITVHYNVSFYPVRIDVDPEICAEIRGVHKVDGYTIAKDLAQFEIILKEIFAAKKTLRVIDAIRAQSVM